MTEQRPAPVAYPPETILTATECAAWLGVSKRSFERLDVPCVYLGTRTRRYLAADVLRWFEKRRRAA
jgi:hypothetical protein